MLRALVERGFLRSALFAVATLAFYTVSGSAQQPSPFEQALTLGMQGSAANGEQLFTGQTGFRNGGPACISCHSIGGLSFPNGGTLGPDLTHAYRKLGPSGTQSAMQTLYFRVMTPIYGPHPLYPQEQADLMAFLQQAESRPQPQWNTQIFVAAALVLAAIFMAITGFVWKDRVRSVRRALVYRATRQGAHL